MDAFLLTLAIFVFWTLLGWATLSLFNPAMCHAQGFLVAPSLGLAVSLTLTFFLNRLGVPVTDFAQKLAFFLTTISICISIFRRPTLSTKHLLIVLGILCFSLILVAHPMFSFSFEWVSYGNDDMANYALGAKFLSDRGFFDSANLDALFDWKDYSQSYWFMFIGGGHRAGAELLLAFFSCITNLSAHQIFMPVICALHLTLIASVGSLVCKSDTLGRSAIVAMLLMSLSPLTSLGVLYQLIGQVGGLALLVSAVVFLCRVGTAGVTDKLLIGSVPEILIIAALFMWYPEVIPFLGIIWAMYVAHTFFTGEQQFLKLILRPAIAAIIAISLLNTYFLTAMSFLFGQVSGGVAPNQENVVAFPYFLIPSGLSAFWGLSPIAGGLREPFVSLLIGFGIILFYVFGRFALIKELRNRNPAAHAVVLMAILALLLFFRDGDFGLFKLAMFAQPFVVSCIASAVGVIAWPTLTWAAKTIGILALPLMVGSQYAYVAKSTGRSFGALNEIPGASEKQVNLQFSKLIDASRGRHPGGFVSDTSNIVLAKFQSLYAIGEDFLFPSRLFFKHIWDTPLNREFSVSRKLDSQEFRNRALLIGQSELKKSESFSTRIANGNTKPNRFYFPNVTRDDIEDRVLVSEREQQTIFNLDARPNNDNFFTLETGKNENHLIFVHSDLGQHYYGGDKSRTSFFQLENDPMFPGRRFSALGENLLFYAHLPSERPRVIMELTSTVVRQHDSLLPKPVVNNQTLGFVGRGTGRVISEPLSLELIDDLNFLSVDMSRKGKLFPYRPRGLMRLYGTKIPEDQRQITCFGRELSLVTEEWFQAARPPSKVGSFPNDLSNRHLEFSGIYEDGWLSEHSFFKLKLNKESSRLKLEGLVPEIDTKTYSTNLKVLVDGEELIDTQLGVGYFELQLPVVGKDVTARVDLIFSSSQKLPRGDNRIIGAKLTQLGFD